MTAPISFPDTVSSRALPRALPRPLPAVRPDSAELSLQLCGFSRHKQAGSLACLRTGLIEILPYC